ncbi:MAG: hypothetical protein ACTJGR_03775, partial [Pauljensenia sp.]
MPATTTSPSPLSEIPVARGVPLDQAVEPLVLAMDIGSTSTRACLYDALARPIRKCTAKAAHQFREGADGTAEIDA